MMLHSFLYLLAFLCYNAPITWEVLPMDKMSMEELGFFLYMEEMERQQKVEQEAQSDTDTNEED